jgi:hypothetical protein
VQPWLYGYDAYGEADEAFGKAPFTDGEAGELGRV